MSDTLSIAETALLGLLAEQDMHPYQIEQEVKYRDMRYWTDLSMSAIYKLLRGLEKKGLVLRSDEVTPENRLRKIYRLSPEGLEALTTQLNSLLSEPEHTKWQVDVAIYNCHLLPKSEALKALLKYKASLEEKINSYHELLKFLKSINCPSHRYSLAIRPIYLLEAELKWLAAFIKDELEGGGLSFLASQIRVKGQDKDEKN